MSMPSLRMSQGQPACWPRCATQYSITENPSINKSEFSGLCLGRGCAKVQGIPSAERRVYRTPVAPPTGFCRV